MPWLPRNVFATLRPASVVSVGGGKATVTIDGGDAAGLPIYGDSPKVGDKVLVAVQGDQMIVLGNGPGRARSSTKRTASATFAANVYGVVSNNATIAAAPPGVYVVSWVALWNRNAGSGTPVGVRVTVGGTVQMEDTVAEVTDDHRKHFSGSLTFVQAAAGVLTATVELRGVLAGIVIQPSSRIDVVRVGP